MCHTSLMEREAYLRLAKAMVYVESPVCGYVSRVIEKDVGLLRRVYEKVPWKESEYRRSKT